MTNQATKQVLLTVLAVGILVVAAVGVSFAAFTYSKSGTTNNIIRTGQIYFRYNEPSSGISLLNAVPIPDYDGTHQIGEGNVFDFGVTSTIKGNKTIDYEIVLEVSESNTLDENKIKVYLVEVEDSNTDVANEKVLLEPTYLSDLPASESKEGAKLLYVGTASEGDNIVKNYLFVIYHILLLLSKLFLLFLLFYKIQHHLLFYRHSPLLFLYSIYQIHILHHIFLLKIQIHSFDLFLFLLELF